MMIEGTVVLALVLIGPSIAMAKGEKINWTPCKKEIAEFCTTYTADAELHECVEEIPKTKVSKACSDFNQKQESQLNHKEGHAH